MKLARSAPPAVANAIIDALAPFASPTWKCLSSLKSSRSSCTRQEGVQHRGAPQEPCEVAHRFLGPWCLQGPCLPTGGAIARTTPAHSRSACPVTSPFGADAWCTHRLCSQEWCVCLAYRRGRERRRRCCKPRQASAALADVDLHTRHLPRLIVLLII